MPYLETAKNDPFLEAAVVGNCNFIIYDGRNLRGASLIWHGMRSIYQLSR
jgi:hypothetical protein